MTQRNDRHDVSCVCMCCVRVCVCVCVCAPATSSFRRLCVLRLPRREKPRPSRRQSATQLVKEALCTAPAAQQRAPQIFEEALCTAPATQRRAAAQPATIRAATPLGGSVYCACHAKEGRGPAGDNPRRSSFRRLCVLRLPRREKARPSRRQSAPQLLQEALCTAPATQRRAAAQPATIRAPAPSGASVSCACHAKRSRGPAGDNPRHNSGSVYCACQAERSRGPAGDNPRRTSFGRLCVLRLPRKGAPRPSRRQSAPQLLQKALCTAPATQREGAAQPATIRAAAPSEGSVYCACHAERSRGPAGDNPRSSSFRSLCVLRLPRKGEPRPSRRQSAPQLLQEALSIAPATHREGAAQPATIRAPASAEGSVYCACHATASRGHGGDYPRHTFFRQLCVLRLPRTVCEMSCV